MKGELWPLDVDIGKAIRQRRMSLGGRSAVWSSWDPVLSITQLAERVGTNRTTVSNIEAGKRSLGVAELFLYAAALETTAEKLLASAEHNRVSRLHLARDVANLGKTLPRATCSVCRRIVAVRNCGTLREHRTSANGPACRGRKSA